MHNRKNLGNLYGWVKAGSYKASYYNFNQKKKPKIVLKITVDECEKNSCAKQASKHGMKEGEIQDKSIVFRTKMLCRII